MRTTALSIAATSLLSGLPSLEHAEAQTGPLLKWDQRFGSPFGPAPNNLGIDGSVSVLAEFDNHVYVAGGFEYAGDQTNVGNIVRWTGTGWSKLQDGLPGAVTAMVVFNDGSGDKLWVSGSFLQSSGAPSNSFAKWDGFGWSAAPTLTDPFAFAEWFATFGGHLYAGGLFGVARLDGTAWSVLLDPLVTGTRGYGAQSSAGQEFEGLLYVAGNRDNISGFDIADGESQFDRARHFGIFDGTTWSTFAGLEVCATLQTKVYNLAGPLEVWNSSLFVGGGFVLDAGAPGGPCISPASYVKRLNSTRDAWVTFGSLTGR